MTQASTVFAQVTRLLTLACALLLPAAAFADDYADVNQLLGNGKFAEALAKADQYIAGKPKDPQMRFLKGMVLTQWGRTAEAIATFTQLVQDYPELPEPYNNLAVLYARQNDFEKARASLESAVRVNPSYAVAHENLGDVYARLAAMSYSKALQLDPRNTTLPPKLSIARQLIPLAPPAAK
jgi:Flp pilus assembly protein TadD